MKMRYHHDEGVSDIVGTITLLAITVTLVGVAVAGFYSAGQGQDHAPPQLDVKASAAPGASSVRVIHAGGTALDRSTLTYKVTAGGTILGNGSFPNPSAGKWDLGQPVDLPLNPGTTLATDGTQTIEISVISSAASAVVASSTVHVGNANPIGTTSPGFVIVSTTPTNATRAQGDSLSIVAWLRHDGGGRKAVTDAWLDLSAINGSPHASLYDDGTHGDRVAGDMNYTLDFTVPYGAVPSGTPYTLSANATDQNGNYTGTTNGLVSITVIPGFAGGGGGGSGGTTIVCSVSPCTINSVGNSSNNSTGTSIVCNVSPCTVNNGGNGGNGTTNNFNNVTCDTSPCTVNEGNTTVTCNVSPCTINQGNTTITCNVSPCTITSGGTGFPPEITSFTPTSGTSSTLVTVNGHNLTTISSVALVAANGTTYGASTWWDTDDSSLSFTPSDVAPSGAYRIRVNGVSGSATSTSTFTLTSATGVLPGNLVMTPGHGKVAALIQIAGDHLDTVRRVQILNATSGYAADAEWWIQGGILVFQIPVSAAPPALSDLWYTVQLAGTAGAVNVTPDLRVDHEPAPIITSFGPTSGTPFTQVNVFGDNFVNVQAVTFNSTNVYWTVVSPTQLLVVTHAGVNPGYYSIRVQTSTGCAQTASPTVGGCALSAPTTPSNGLFRALRAPVVPVYQADVFKNVSVWAQHNATGGSGDTANVYVKVQLNDTITIGGETNLKLVTTPSGCTGAGAVDTTSTKLCDGFYYNPFKPGNQPPTPFQTLVCSNVATKTYVFQYNTTLANYVSNTFTFSFYLEFSFSSTGSTNGNSALLHPVSVTTNDPSQYFNLAPTDTELTVYDHGTATNIQSCT